MTARMSKRRIGMVTVTQAAAFLKMSRADLYAWLRENDWLPPKGEEPMPRPAVFRQELMEFDFHTFNHRDGTPDRRITPLITRAGFKAIKAKMEEALAHAK